MLTGGEGVRLYLYDKYVGRKTVNAWRNVTTSASDYRTGTGNTFDHDNDDGTAPLAVMKAMGDFYMTNGSGAFDQTNPSSATIGANTKADPDIISCYPVCTHRT